EHLEVLVLSDPSVRNLRRRVIDNRTSLEIAISNLMLEAQRSIFQLPKSIIEELIDFAAVDECRRLLACPEALAEKIDARFKADIFVIQQIFKQPRVTSDRNPFVAIVKVAIIIRAANRQPANDRRRQLARFAAPLLRRIAPDECLVNIA